MTAIGDYYGFDLAWLKTHEQTVLAAIEAATLANSYTHGSGVSSRSVQREKLADLRADAIATRAEINRQEAIANDEVDPTPTRSAYADFSGANVS